MENWVIYGLIAAFLIAVRDMFSKSYIHKYTTTEHLLHYYIFASIFFLIYAFYKKYYVKERVEMVDTEDIWKYILMAFLGAIIISPCQLLSLKECKNPGKSKAIINLNTILASNKIF